MQPYRLSTLLGLFAAIGLVFGSVSYAAGPPLSLDEYWQKVERTQTLLADLETAPAEESGPKLLLLADEWERITRVTLPNGSQMPLDHSFLVAQLRADPPDLARLRAQFVALSAARAAWPQAKHTAPDLESLASVLARPEFQWQPQQPSPLAKLWQQFLDYLLKLIASLLPEGSSRASLSIEGQFLRYGLTALGVLTLSLAIILSLRALWFDLVAEAEIAQNSHPDEILTADTAFKQAQTLSGAGDFRTAVRYLYLSTLLLLDERDLLRYDRAQTNREYLRSVKDQPQLAATLRDVIEIFDRVWYGYQPIDPAAYAHYAARVTELRQQK